MRRRRLSSWDRAGLYGWAALAVAAAALPVVADLAGLYDPPPPPPPVCAR